MRRLIGITPEENVFCEQRRLANFILSGQVTYLHIRKPHFTEQQMRDYLSYFKDDNVKKNLSLNDYQHLAIEYGIGGIHLNKRCHKEDYFTDQYEKKYPQLRYSISCHSIQEADFWKDKVDYCFLSPIFDSISKPGHNSAFTLPELQKAFLTHHLNDKVCALGGVTYNNISELENAGFTSFALLSSLWQMGRTMFITHKNDKYNYLSGAIEALKGGIRFVQLRMKGASDEEVLQTAKTLREYCDKYAALLTIDDRIDLLQTNLFDGVHLGKNDMPISQAKQITADKYLLGATCNTVQDVQNAIDSGADYLGIGPYRFTTTKTNLSTILGKEGYAKIVAYMRDHNLHTPIYAIGGIEQQDIASLMQTGIYGIALSGVILRSQEAQKTANEIVNLINTIQK